MQTSRGCPYSCIYCDIPSLSQGTWRHRSAAHVLGEMQHLNDMGYRSIYLTDDHFLLNRKRISEVCHGIIERGLKFHWGCEGRVDAAGVNQLRLMKQANCNFLAFRVGAGTQKAWTGLANVRPSYRLSMRSVRPSGRESSGCTDFLSSAHPARPNRMSWPVFALPPVCNWTPSASIACAHRVELDGVERARVVTPLGSDTLVAEVVRLEDGDEGDEWGPAIEALARYLHAHPDLRSFLDQQRRSSRPMAWVNLACQHLPITASARQKLLESDPAGRCQRIGRGLDALLRKEKGD